MHTSKQALARVCLFLMGMAGPGCSDDEGSRPHKGESLPKAPLGVQVNWGGLKERQNLEVNVDKMQLGRLLFFDRRLSADGDRACATCHDPERAFSSPLPAPEAGASSSRRQAPPLVNVGFPLELAYSWDGSTRTLVEQTRKSLESPAELGASPDTLVETLRALPGYVASFSKAYSGEANLDHVADALAAYVVTRLSGSSPWDRWRKGDERAATADAQEGYELFMGPARCSACHKGWNFTDGKFHNLGVGWKAQEHSFADPGRAGVTGEDADRGSFKTPTLRDVARRPPYMHDGSLATLKDVVAFYNKGGAQNPGLDGKVVELNLTDAQMGQIVAFLESLTGEGYLDTAPDVFP